ncbi:MAG TPA: hypothetical protein VE983_02595 [Solirubrobacteraceae bacterium]|nr:hypothetical protein [Solirubrobacteraceae bacterium]
MIGDRLAWAHLPKAGGDATTRMFLAVPGLVRFADPPDSDDKHLPFFAREPDVEGKLLSMNIRRLPEWKLSAAHHRARHGLSPDYRPLPLPSAEELASSRDGDALLRWMTDHGRFRIDRWLRMEALEQDVLALVGELGLLNDEVAAAIRAVGRVNVGDYHQDVRATFSDVQMHRLYAGNPGWTALERELYGDLLI